jgi:brefeldin A-inhibited guanine nucleotide-exchange protein
LFDLCSLCLEILSNYNKFDADAKQRNVAAWRPVIVAILTAIMKFNENQFQKHIEFFYSPVIRLLFHEMPQDIRLGTYQVLQRAGKQMGLLKEEMIAPQHMEQAIASENVQNE